MASHDQDTPDSLDIVVEVLSDQRRRSTLACLKKYDTSLALADLAEEVAIREYDATITEIAAGDVKRVYMSLYHQHIPKMTALDVVQYDQESDVVALNETSEHLPRCFNLLELE